MTTCCNPSPTDKATQQKVAQLEKDLQQNNSKDYQQDSEILQLKGMWRCAVQEAVTEYLENMQAAGELDGVLAGITETMQPYYSGIETHKRRGATTGTDYYVTVVPKQDANGQAMRWKLGVANDAYNGVGREGTISFAHRKNATVAVNAGVFDIDTGAPLGVLIQNSRIVYSGVAPSEDKYQYLAIMNNGSFKVYPRSASAGQMLNEGATDAVCIFGSLIVDGYLVAQTDLRTEPRQSIGVRANGDVVIVTADGRNPGEDVGFSYDDLAMIHASEGSVNAWILDGGGSTATVLRGVKQNDNVDYFYTDREVNTFLYIVKDNTADPTTNPSNDIGTVKQQLIEKIMERIDFYNGYIRLRGPENYYAPGIEMYVNAEEKRRCKMGLAIDKATLRNSYFYIAFRAGETELSNMFRIYDQGVYMQTYHGTSAERPNGPLGMMYFDESINKPIWRGTNGWVDATGAAV